MIAGDVFGNLRPVTGWRLVGDARAVPGERKLECSGEGRVLVNVTPGQKGGAPYLYSLRDYGDAAVHVEFMVPHTSNSGVYLMGRYEVQILDSFGKQELKYGDLGGIYQRIDAADPARKRGYEGTPPRRNVARAPGEWQTMDITFRAPRFDAAGRKTENARFLRVVVNGVTVQENVEVTGPTQAHPLDGEVTAGPVAIQGNHGPIAIRSFRVGARDFP